VKNETWRRQRHQDSENILEIVMTPRQGIEKYKGEIQPSDKDRAQTAHKTSSDDSVSREGTRNLKLDDRPKKSGSQ
jgi:hypothetical protein